jgi:hypothetical protein
MSVVSENADPALKPAQATQPAAPNSAATDDMVISRSEFDRLKKEEEAFKTYRTKQQAEADAKEAQRVAAIAASNGTAKELAEIENRYKAKEATLENRVTSVTQRLHSNLTKAVLADATAGVVWTSSAAGKDALAKLASNFEVLTIGDGVEEVRERGTGRKAAEVVKQLLDSEDYLHFQSPTTRGKGGIGNGNTAGQSGGQGGAEVDMIDAIVAKVAEDRKAFKAQTGLEITRGFGRRKA